MIVDLSLSFGHSVSNGISNKLASVSCSSCGHLSHTHLWMTLCSGGSCTLGSWWRWTWSRPTTPSAPSLSRDFMGEKCICGSSSASWAKIRAEKFHCGTDMIAWVLHRAGLQDQGTTSMILISRPPPPPPPHPHGYWRSCQAPVSCSVSYRGGTLGYPPQTYFFTQTF